MIDPASFALFLAAALLIAVTPGPGIFYVAARTLAGGRGEGMASTIGTGIGGLVHVVLGAAGVSALVMASAQAFTVLKMLGAAYLIWLGIKTFREAAAELPAHIETAGSRLAFREGILVEALNPKTAAFFLAFIPQFVDPAGAVAWQFITLGLITVFLNTLVDFIVVIAATRARDGFAKNPGLIRRLRQGSGLVMFGLGASLAVAKRG